MCLGASLRVSHTFSPLVKGFVFGGSSLNVVLANLFPLLRQSVDWFKELVGEQRVMSEVRSIELEMEFPLAMTLLRWRKTLQLLAQGRLGLFLPSGRSVAWTPRPSLDLGIGFNFSRGLEFIVLIKRNEPTTFHLGRCASTKLLSTASLGFLSTHSL